MMKYTCSHLLRLVTLLILASCFLFSCASQNKTASGTATLNNAVVTNFNDGWEFVKDIDNTRRSDITWQQVSLPHTARIEAIEKKEQQWQGTAFYRKAFQLPTADKGRHVTIKFEAAMQVADVYLNGEHVFRHLGGYLPFTVDISDDVKFGQENVILVKLNNEDNPAVPPGKPLADLDFNYYSGLYRNVYLITKDKLYISDPVAANRVAGGGVLLHYNTVSQEEARLMVQTEIKNDYLEAKEAQIRTILKDKQGKVVAEALSAPTDVAAGSFGTIKQHLSITNPSRWSPDMPYLYTLTVELLQDGKPIDHLDLKTGIKNFRFTADAFYLNGEKLFLRGTNRHQEYPYIGYALSDNAQYRDAYKIKEADFNFVRSSHYPQSPAFLVACDALGILVMDAIPGWQFFGDEAFQKNSIQDVRDMVRRDRNHPSIILWEASLNESGMTKEYMEAADKAVHEELPFPHIYSIGWIDYAYDVFAPARQHAKAPDYWNKYDKQKPLLIAEYGDWEYYAQNAGFNQKTYADLAEEARTSRQLRGAGQKRMLQQALNFQEAHNSNLQGPAVGDANWLMYDYKRGYAPDIESSGIMDIMRLPKFAYYFYQSQAGPDQTAQAAFGKPMIFIANYWNDPALTTVKVYSNSDEVELQLNGKTIARQQPDKDAYSTNLHHPPFTFKLPQYTPGALTAIGYINHKKVVKTERKTPGEPARIALSIDESGKELTAGVNDVVFVYASITDAQGAVVPNAANPVAFKVEGDAEIMGESTVSAEAGIAAILVRAGKTAGIIRISASTAGLEPGTATVRAKTAK